MTSTITCQPVADLGCFTQGEKPFSSLLHTFLDDLGHPIPIGGMQVRFTWRERWTDPATAGTGNGIVVGAGTGGQAQYNWAGPEFALPGHYRAELWVGDTLRRVASQQFRWTVKAAVGPVPPI